MAPLAGQAAAKSTPAANTRARRNFTGYIFKGHWNSLNHAGWQEYLFIYLYYYYTCYLLCGSSNNYARQAALSARAFDPHVSCCEWDQGEPLTKGCG
jgi:hypothetical protein